MPSAYRSLRTTTIVALVSTRDVLAVAYHNVLGSFLGFVEIVEAAATAVEIQITAIASTSICQPGMARAVTPTRVEAGAFFPKNSSRIDASSVR